MGDRLADKTAIITGSGRGTGRACGGRTTGSHRRDIR
jgi:NAD(P)-dependent dehydrogenase (short-subunit alcohol dehydrogenase family)